ncbi:hypothetical protein BCR32DRAFT_284359 [Anaeromyces robustus]|uniref:Uncharacterized protein n=1 Tax=Anaeromyces robustus TaxID=1754192 RepID=A0A1Y1WRW1_9FUNG|nr:hypothetical protein BCR32DRAFT_284359 [Anaeromyces robustus]|eukprot:ORX76283.1 hypothetical protein BCR32DRAFT_284359 [Anaeromyces robustus]
MSFFTTEFEKKQPSIDGLVAHWSSSMILALGARERGANNAKVAGSTPAQSKDARLAQSVERETLNLKVVVYQEKKFKTGKDEARKCSPVSSVARSAVNREVGGSSPPRSKKKGKQTNNSDLHYIQNNGKSNSNSNSNNSNNNSNSNDDDDDIHNSNGNNDNRNNNNK